MSGGIKRGTVTAAALILGGTAGTAQAAEIISVPLSSLLYNGQSYSGSFDISGFLVSGGDQYQVTSAQVDVQGYSQYGASYSYISGYYTAFGGYYIAGYYSYDCGWFRTCYSPYYAPYYTTVPQYAYADGVQDHLFVDVGSATGFGSDTDKGPPTNYYGTILATANLSDGDLAQANSSGLVNYMVGATTNANVQLQGATLTFGLERITSAVPEPTTWAMMMVGFGAIGGAMRKKRARKDMVAA